MVESTLDQKYDRLRNIIRSLDRVAVAFSAGVDSTLVLKVGLDVLGPDRVTAVTGRSDSLATAEFESAVALTDRLGARHVVLDTDEFDNADYLANPQNRCYFCKTTLYGHMTRFIEREGIKHIINGINADDYGDWRPGIAAATEHAVRCPVAEAGMNKSDVRALSKRLALPNFDKPASPCLSSRVQYGEPITPEKLKQVESCEAFLHALGFAQCRVRHHDNLARVEVPADQIERISAPDLARRIVEHFRRAGYQYVTLDLQGFRSGSMNEVIAFGKPQPVHESVTRDKKTF